MKVSGLEALPERMSAVEAQIVQLRTEMRGECSAVRRELQGVEGRLRALNDETRAEMRMLHEEVIDRISRIGEGGR